MSVIKAPVPANVVEVMNLLIMFLAATNGGQSVPLVRDLLKHLNTIPGALPVIVRTLELMVKAKSKLDPATWQRAFKVAASDFAARKLAEAWLRMTPVKVSGPRPRVLSASDWETLRRYSAEG